MNKSLIIFAAVVNFLFLINQTALSQQYPVNLTSPKLLQYNKNSVQPLTTSVYAHTEPASATNPANPNNIVVAFNSTYPQTNPSVFTQGVKHSTDGGVTWTPIDALPKANELGYASDPGVAFSSNGTAYVSYIGYNGTTFDVLYSTSTDGGASWSNPDTAYSSSGLDRPNIFCDNDPSSPYKDRLYFAWSNSNGTYLTNGIEFTSPSLHSVYQISNDVGWGVDMATDENHNLYVLWCDFNGNIHLQKSTDGGKDWLSSQLTVATGLTNPVTIGGLRARYYPSIAVDKTSAHPNRIYVAYHSGASSGVDVFTTYSDNGGTSWSSPKQVNDDHSQGSPNGKFHWFPWISITNQGVVHVVFYDDRNSSNTLTVQSFVASSFDGGQTYNNEPVTSQYTLSAIAGLGNGSDYVGDYLAMTDGNLAATGSWMQPSSNGAFDVLSSPSVATVFSNQVGTSNPGGSLSVSGIALSSGTQVNLLSGAGVVEKTLCDGTSDPDRFPNFNGAIQKHNNWNSSSSAYALSNNYVVPLSSSTQYQDAYFNALNPATITASSYDGLSTSNMQLQFNDPWYLNSNGSQGNNFAQAAPPITQNSAPMTGAYNQTSGGVFLGMGHYPYWDQPHYSVGFPSGQTISVGGTNHGLSVAYWSASGATIQNSTASQTGVEFTSSNATVTANVKATQLSNDPSAYSNNSSRKFVETPDGVMWQTYTSDNHVWLEYSTDGGTTWQLMQTVSGSGYLAWEGQGKCPSPTRCEGVVLLNEILMFGTHSSSLRWE